MNQRKTGGHMFKETSRKFAQGFIDITRIFGIFWGKTTKNSANFKLYEAGWDFFEKKLILVRGAFPSISPPVRHFKRLSSVPSSPGQPTIIPVIPLDYVILIALYCRICMSCVIHPLNRFAASPYMYTYRAAAVV